jgi:hypothetical protein
MPKPPSSTHRTTDATDRLDGMAKAASDSDATVETFAKIDTTRPLAARDGEHGHIDGPRGIQDFHGHPGGDQPHGHKRDSTLGRTASIDEYVPPLAATVPPGADQTTDPPPAGVPDPGEVSEPSAPASSRTGAGSDAAGAGRSTALVLADTAILEGLAGRMEATERKIRGRLAEFEIVAGLAQLVDAAAKQLDYDDRVSPQVISRFKNTINGWAEDRGVNGS